MESSQQNSFMFYGNFLDAIEQLPEGDRANACYQFCRYALNDELPEDKSLAMFCIGVRYSVHKYQGRGGARIGAGRPKKSESLENQNNQNNQKIQNTQTETKTETKTERVNNRACARESFTPPTLDEFLTTAKQWNDTAGMGGFECTRTQAESFWSHYDSQGWMKSNGYHITNIKSAFLSWVKREQAKQDTAEAVQAGGVEC